NIGCSDKMDYSIIGDTVNTAARIEGLTKEYGVPILMSEQLFENLKGKVEAVQLGSSLVKGKRKHIHIYTLKSILNHMERQALSPPEGEQNPEADKKEGHDNGEPVN
ncbi:MAG: adenylate/guanylate cyclase domain-containing protein, partial [Nitrospinota bacterium]|nr:adenylate/guanylate cyclase domain-containing protein [Nitrospinota bacterium]